MRILFIFFISVVLASPATETPEFQSPVNSPVVSKFGKRVHPVNRTERMHFGVDYKVPVGTNVFAAADGKVIFAGEREEYGNVIILKHEGDLETWYANLSTFSEGINTDKTVKSGEKIALSGASGLSVTSHLHFAIRKKGEFVNPEMYLTK